LPGAFIIGFYRILYPGLYLIEIKQEMRPCEQRKRK